jgi:hypothetical protein
VSQIATARIRV